jgi:hypothetical protein
MGKKSARQKMKVAHANLCDDLQSIHQVNEKEAGRQEAAGNSSDAASSQAVADAAQADAKKWKCGWAS